MPDSSPPPRTFLALRRGFLRRCPNCGQGRLFQGYLKITDRCSDCREKLGHIRADDIPAYFTIVIVGHVVVPLMLAAVQMDLPDWFCMSAFPALTLLLTVLLLPSVKGTVAAHLWRLGMPEGHDPAQGEW